MSENKEIHLRIKEVTLWKGLTFLFAALFVIFLVLFITSPGTSTAKAAAPSNPSEGANNGPNVLKVQGDVKGADSPVLGDENAKISIVEFSDFQCPFCGRAHVGALADMKNSADFKNGDLNLIYRHFPLSSIHPYAQKAAEASVCAQKQGKFWEYHDLLFANQQALDINSLKAYASQLGLDTNTFNSCLDSGESADKVAQDVKDATSLGARGTPYFLIVNNEDGKMVPVSGALPWSSFQQAIDLIK